MPKTWKSRISLLSIFLECSYYWYQNRLPQNQGRGMFVKNKNPLLMFDKHENCFCYACAIPLGRKDHGIRTKMTCYALVKCDSLISDGKRKESDVIGSVLRICKLITQEIQLRERNGVSWEKLFQSHLSPSPTVYS